MDNHEQTDLKYIISLLPKVVEGRELSFVWDKVGHWWYAGHPTLDGDFSVGKYANDEDFEGAALNLLSQFDEENKEG